MEHLFCGLHLCSLTENEHIQLCSWCTFIKLQNIKEKCTLKFCCNNIIVFLDIMVMRYPDIYRKSKVQTGYPKKMHVYTQYPNQGYVFNRYSNKELEYTRYPKKCYVCNRSLRRSSCILGTLREISITFRNHYANLQKYLFKRTCIYKNFN